MEFEKEKRNKEKKGKERKSQKAQKEAGLEPVAIIVLSALINLTYASAISSI